MSEKVLAIMINTRIIKTAHSNMQREHRGVSTEVFESMFKIYIFNNGNVVLYTFSFDVKIINKII